MYVLCEQRGQEIIFLINIIGADSNTLTLISTFITSANANNINHLLLIGAYRSNEVTDGHPLLQTLHEVKAKGLLRELHLTDLNEEDVVMLIEDSFNKNPSKCNLILVHSLALILFFLFFVFCLFVFLFHFCTCFVSIFVNCFLFYIDR
jgi:hypothetical protein